MTLAELAIYLILAVITAEIGRRTIKDLLNL